MMAKCLEPNGDAEIRKQIAVRAPARQQNAQPPLTNLRAAFALEFCRVPDVFTDR
jgi:hypothetical protein